MVNNKKKKPIYLLYYFIASLFIMEVTFRFITSDRIVTFSLLVSLLFTITISLLLFFLVHLFSGKVRLWISTILLTIFGLVFSSQLIYFDFFRTFYSLYSAGNASQIFEFWEDIWGLIVKNLLWLILLFLPAIILAVLGSRFISFEKTTRLNKGIVAGFVLVAHLLSLGVITVSGKGQHTAYDLYFKNSLPIISAEKLGLLTTMRLQLQRQITGWSPKIDIVNPYLPVSAAPKDEDVEGDPGEAKEESPENDVPKEPVVEEKVEYNSLDIHFDELIANETNEDIIEMHNYFKNAPITEKNDFTGKFKGYNLIFITAEGFSPYAVHPEATPTLYKLVHEGYQFSNFYNPLWEVSTSDGEYVATQGLLPKSGVWSFSESSDNSLPFVMGNQLKKQGYKTVAYHNHSYTYYDRHLSHPNMGYDYKGVGNGLDIKVTWPESDLEMMEVSIPEYIHEEPFHAYHMTVSGHMQYSFDGNVMARRNKEAVQDLPLSQQAQAYIATQVELDKAMEHLLTKLEEAGVLDNTLIALSADHYPYGLEDETINELAGHTVEKNFELYKSPFILYTTNMAPLTIEEPVSSLDIIPTLSNLLGLEYDSRLLMGVDIFSDADPLVMFLNRSFITDKGRFNALTQEFIPNDNSTVDQDYVEQMKAIVTSKFYFSTKILDHDYYRIVLGENE